MATTTEKADPCDRRETTGPGPGDRDGHQIVTGRHGDEFANAALVESGGKRSLFDSERDHAETRYRESGMPHAHLEKP